MFSSYHQPAGAPSFASVANGGIIRGGEPHATLEIVEKRKLHWIVVGAGIAGLRAALTLSAADDVTLVTKEAASESNTHYAQGGIAVAMGGTEDVQLHGKDTIDAGDGLVFEPAARLLVEEGPVRVAELLAWGTKFDREHGDLMRTREGAHSLPRILHANGDATGREIGRALLEQVRREPRIHLYERVTTCELIQSDGRVVGVAALDESGRAIRFTGDGVLLASGGAGQVYSDTTNPSVATGDGIAMAYRVGAEVSDMEFYQFHPTALDLAGAPRFLLSEALRGEGAYLRNSRGERFMESIHPLKELAPRDVVARAIARESKPDPSGGNVAPLPVYLDMRHLAEKNLNGRFPGISAFLKNYGLELGRDLIPVGPAAHYLMGGVRTDLAGRTSLPGLYAAGEVACTGVHGANRLASNSLLEGLVFGARAAESMLRDGAWGSSSHSERVNVERGPVVPIADSHVTELRERLRRQMWLHAGLLRDREGLTAMQEELEAMRSHLPTADTREGAEMRNLHTVAGLIVASALAREESRGAHARTDFPQHTPGPALHSRMVEDRVDFIAFS